MKKTSISVLVLLALVFSGCTNNTKKKKASKNESVVSETSVDKTSLNPTSQAPVTSASASSINPTWSGESPSQVTSVAPESSSNVVPPSGEFTVTIATAGTDFYNNSGFHNYGIEILPNADSAKNHLQTLKNYFVTTCGYEDALTNLSCSFMFVQTYTLESVDYLTMCVGAASDAKGAGSMTWISNFDIVKVEAKVRAYYKYYSYESGGELIENWNHDAYANFNLGDVSKQLPIGEHETEQQLVSYEPTTPVKEFTLSNGTQIPSRIFLEELKITFNA